MAIRTATAARTAVKSTVKTSSKTVKNSTVKKSVSTNAKNTAKSSTAKTLSTKSKTPTSAAKSTKTQSVKRDTFTKTGAVQTAGIYSVPKTKSNPALGFVSVVSDTVKAIGMNTVEQNKTVNSRLNNISPEVMYCQTAGWWESPIDGSNRCSYTAIATAASINLGTSIKPNQVTDGCNKFDNGSVKMDRWKKEGSLATISTVQEYYDKCQEKGFRYYRFSSSDKVLDVINNELANDRSIVVKTDYSGEHWVTVTGTVNGQKATQFSDLKGIDPWFNGTGNKDASGNIIYNNNPSYSGVFQLSQNSNQTFHGDYAVMTISGGR
ncbi:MAG: hypothetical protein NC084_09940 [Bacteroides sp.]|nr:hypothetical protein [Eubacterium sp.]MCM1419369.1 hypothetical protein [Roseburia sp.]MCM1463019.1 hypothetical protein [Bacteroides sp.]